MYKVNKVYNWDKVLLTSIKFKHRVDDILYDYFKPKIKRLPLKRIHITPLMEDALSNPSDEFRYILDNSIHHNPSYVSIMQTQYEYEGCLN